MRPKLDPEFENPPYKALSLAWCTVGYLSRATTGMDGKNIYDDSWASLKDWWDYSRIRLHPTRRCFAKAEWRRKGRSLVGECVCLVLFELVHAFV